MIEWKNYYFLKRSLQVPLQLRVRKLNLWVWTTFEKVDKYIIEIFCENLSISPSKYVNGDFQN